MTDAKPPIILGVDEDRSAQAVIAQAFNDQGVFYRFVTDRRKVIGGVQQLSPHLLLVFGELESDFVIQVLDALASDVSSAQKPVVVVSRDISDGPFVQGMRSGVIGLLPSPFAAAHIGVVRALYEETLTRTGTSSGIADAATLRRLMEHIRRTRRTGVLITNPRTPNEGRASFLYGKLDRASFLGAHGVEAVNTMLSQPSLRWTFNEVAGAQSEGAGVVIEVGEALTGETPVAEVIVGEDEPLGFEVPAPPQPAPPPPSSVGAHLLLVDDDPAILKMFSTLFTKHGFAVTTARDGAEGFEVALQRPFEALLADLNMPHLDGWGMLRALREDFRTRELPIAFLSAHDDYRESLRALDAGAQAYLSKGTRLDVIVGQVTKLLEPRRAMQALLASGHAQPLAINAVGPQWFMRQLALQRVSGLVVVRDGWATYQLGFNDGMCFHASAVAGRYTAEGERAFNAFIASRDAEGSFTRGGPPPLQQNLFLPTEAMVERAALGLNENERRMRESLMVSATQIEVNPDLYAVYTVVGPKRWIEAARLICEEGTPPRDVIARLDLSPLEIEECMKDLIRRGVVTLKKP